MNNVRLEEATEVTLEYFAKPVSLFSDDIFVEADLPGRIRQTVLVPIPFNGNRKRAIQTAIAGLVKIPPNSDEYKQKMIDWGVVVISVEESKYKIAVED